MTNERFVNNYLKPFMIAFDTRVIDIRYIDRPPAGYQLINILFEGCHCASIDVTGKTQREMTDEVFKRINNTPA